VPQDLTLVSDTKTGVYCFQLRFPSSAELGIGDKSISLDTVKENILDKLDAFDQALNFQKMRGSFRDEARKGMHMLSLFEFNGNSRKLNPVTNLFNDAQKSGLLSTEDEVKMYIEISARMIDVLPPVYIGIATEQSLRTRLKQHLAGGSSVLEKLIEYDLSWPDVVFKCVEQDGLNKGMARNLEKTFQGLARPKFSTI